MRRPKFWPQSEWDEKAKETWGSFINIMLNDASKIVFFIGAGVSKLCGYPLWNELAIELIKKYWEKKDDLKNKNLLNWSQKEFLLNLAINKPILVMDYLKFIDEDKFYIFLESIFSDYKKKVGKGNTGIYDTIYKLGERYKSIYLYTNIDDSFETTVNINDNISINPGFNKNNKLYYIHGKINNDIDKMKEGLVFTKEDYNKHYLRETGRTSLSNFLIESFTENNIIFIGYSLNDFEILQQLYISCQNKVNNKKFILTGFSEYERLQLRTTAKNILENYNINTIYYNIEEKGYECLENVLQEIIKTIKFKYMEKSDNQKVGKDEL